MKKFLTVLAVILLIALGVVAFFLFADYSDGVRTGAIMKMSKKGVLFKTNEGQLNIGGMDQSDGSSLSNVWYFSVTDQEVINEINHAIDSSQRVKLFYKEKYVVLPWRGDTKYFVYKVEELGQL